MHTKGSVGALGRPSRFRLLSGIAWHKITNQQMAASIMGYIRQAALGDPLVPYEQRVEKALQRILATRSWTPHPNASGCNALPTRPRRSRSWIAKRWTMT